MLLLCASQNRVNRLDEWFELFGPVGRNRLFRPTRLLRQVRLREELVLTEEFAQKVERLTLAFQFVPLIGIGYSLP